MKFKQHITRICTVLALPLMLLSCEDKGLTDGIEAPSGLQATEVTESSALLQWKGAGDFFEVAVNSETHTASGTSLKVENLAPQENYQWKVRARQGAEYSDWTDGNPFTTLKQVDAPTEPAAEELGNYSALLKWKGAAEGYEVEINGDVLPAAEPQLRLTELEPGTNYTWKVRAKSGAKYSLWTDGPDFGTLPLPDAPSALQASEISNYSVKLTWQGDSDSYEISIGNTVYEADSEELSIENLTADRQYSWKVRGEKEGVFSLWTEPQTFRTLKTPGAPHSFYVDGLTHDTAILLWRGSSESYDVEIGGRTKTVDDSQWILSDLDERTNYPWRVRPRNGLAVGQWVDGCHFATKAESPETAPDYIRLEMDGRSYVSDRPGIERFKHNGNYYFGGAFMFAPAGKIPKIGIMFPYAVQVTQLPHAMEYYVEYYDEFYETTRRMYAGSAWEGNYGNWRTQSGEFEITEITETTFSGITHDLLLLDAYELDIMQNPSYTVLPVVLEFYNVEYTIKD